MCHACVIEAVKRSMLSRRQLFAGVAAGAASVAAGLTSARPALAQASGRIIDLTHAYDGSFPTFDGNPGISYEADTRFTEFGVQIWQLRIMEHTGTHVDAPLHYSPGNASVDEIAPEKLMAPLCVLDHTAKAREDPNAMVESQDIEAWVSAHGEIPAGACFAMHSGWAAKVGTPEFAGGPEGLQAFPGFSEAAVVMLEEMDVASIGVDTLSFDPGNTTTWAAHYAWLPSGRFAIECLAGLDQVPATGATIFIGAPKHKQGTGGPARILAVV
jgi:kynurenine formamidase